MLMPWQPDYFVLGAPIYFSESTGDWVFDEDNPIHIKDLYEYKMAMMDSMDGSFDTYLTVTDMIDSYMVTNRAIERMMQ